MNPTYKHGIGRFPHSAEARRFCKAKPLAAQIGVCSKTLFRWADEGKIHRHKLNARVVLFEEAEIYRFIDSARIPTNLDKKAAV